MSVTARLVSARESGGLFEAELELGYEGRTYRVRVGRLTRRPVEAHARLRGDYVLVELRDERGGPVATCCIHRGHLERGCMDCPSLLVPPRG